MVSAFCRCGNRRYLVLDAVVNDFSKHHGMWYLLCDVVNARCGICDVVSADYRNVACVPYLQL